MDATPSFGVTMISEVPSNPQLTLECINFETTCVQPTLKYMKDTVIEIREYSVIDSIFFIVN